MLKYILTGPANVFDESIFVSGSKSISNRLLIIKAISSGTGSIENLSTSEDTQRLIHCLNQDDGDEYNLNHAGTSFRFLTAFYAIAKGNQILTGSRRMKERPIAPLVEALRSIGADIEYLENAGFPPLKIKPFDKQKSNSIKIKADISSQFISALCLIAPTLEHGLEIYFDGEPVSSPYIKMTLALMNDFGVKSSYSDNCIKIKSQVYTDREYTVESDWSSASYLLGILALSPGSKLKLNLFFKNSIQGDSQILEIIQKFGVDYIFDDNQLVLTNTKHCISELEMDFIDCPDLFQTVCILAAAKNIPLKAKGLKTLLLKESDRTLALQTELAKVGIKMIRHSDDECELKKTEKYKLGSAVFKAYQDHRNIMSLSLLSMISPITLCNPQVVEKSYPEFWKDLKKIGFKIESPDQ